MSSVLLLYHVQSSKKHLSRANRKRKRVRPEKVWPTGRVSETTERAVKKTKPTVAGFHPKKCDVYFAITGRELKLLNDEFLDSKRYSSYFIVLLIKLGH